ncbi:hypothetical protein L1887_51979 [Cichorium endivia]|nr:hypothetical protein L1887_51979 [Cichorium endivia]
MCEVAGRLIGGWRRFEAEGRRGAWDAHPCCDVGGPEEEAPYVDVDVGQECEPCESDEECPGSELSQVVRPKNEAAEIEVAREAAIGGHVLAVLFVKDEGVVAELAVLFPRVLEPFYEAVLVAVADGAGALARMVERRIWLGPATADATRVIFVHGERSSVSELMQRSVRRGATLSTSSGGGGGGGKAEKGMRKGLIVHSRLTAPLRSTLTRPRML